jgi:hypothetical protein
MTTHQLPDSEITGELLKVSPLKKAVPQEAEQLEEEAFALMPHLKITELLLGVDQWIDFTRHFTHLRSGELARDRSMFVPACGLDWIRFRYPCGPGELYRRAFSPARCGSI